MKRKAGWWLAWVLLGSLLGLSTGAAGEQGAGAPTAPGPEPLRVCLVSGSREYRSDESLRLLEQHLVEEHGVICHRAFGNDKGDSLPGVEQLPECDVMVLFARRMNLPPEQMKIVRAYVEAGKPIVGVRTASHAFQNWEPDWKAFDRLVLGGSYEGHYGNALAKIDAVPDAEGHPVLKGVRSFSTTGKLYKNPRLAEDVTLLLKASTDEYSEPVAWVRMHKGGRIFYSSLGTPEDFQNKHFRRLLVNALFWVSGQ